MLIPRAGLCVLFGWCVVLKLSVVPLGLFLFVQLSGCQLEEGLGSPLSFAGPASSASSTCSPEIQQQLVQAVDIMAERGFSGDQIDGFLINATDRDEVGCPGEGPWTKRLQERFGTTYGSSMLDAIIYDIHTGERYDMRNPAQVARALPECYKSDDVHAACNPRFHPQYPDPVLHAELLETADKECWEDPQWGETCQYFTYTPKACLLTRKWKQFCKTPESADGCWSYARADLVTAPPPKAVQNRIELAAARRVEVEVASAAGVPAQTSSAPVTPSVPVSRPQGNYCEDLDIF